MRGSDSATRELRKNGKGNADEGSPKTQEWSCEEQNGGDFTGDFYIADPASACPAKGGKQWITSGETKGTPDDCKACCECDDKVDENIVNTGFCTSTSNGCLELLGNHTCDDACNWVPTRKLPKNGGGSKGNGGGGGAKTQEWSCEAVNAPGYPDDITDITKGDDEFTCVNGGKKGEDTCQPCCLCGDEPTGVCSKEGACSGVALLGNATCTDACTA